MFAKSFPMLLVLAAVAAGCASGTPKKGECPLPERPRTAANVIIPRGDDPPFVVRFDVPDPTRWREARNVHEGDDVAQLRLTDAETGARIDFLVVRASSVASMLTALGEAEKALKDAGAEVTPRTPALPLPERVGLRFSANPPGKPAMRGAVEVRSFPPRVWAVLAIGTWPAAADAESDARFEAMLSSMTYVPTGPLEPKAALAQCLADKGVKMYSAWWCGPCQWQKKQFGDAVSRLPIVECYPEGKFEPEVPECRDAKLKSVPTWEFPDGTRVGESMSLPKLAAKAGCPYEEK